MLHIASSLERTQGWGTFLPGWQEALDPERQGASEASGLALGLTEAQSATQFYLPSLPTRGHKDRPPTFPSVCGGSSARSAQKQV